MRVWTALMVVALAAGCAGSPQAGAGANTEPPVEKVTGPVAEGTEAKAPTPAGLYEACHDRVELPEADGECTSDADCARAGCGAEVCTTVAAAKEMMSTCEIKPCFKVLDTCGCHEGRCDWTLKAEVPEMKQIDPSKLPR